MAITLRRDHDDAIDRVSEVHKPQGSVVSVLPAVQENKPPLTRPKGRHHLKPLAKPMHPLAQEFLAQLDLLNERWQHNASVLCRHFCLWLEKEMQASAGANPQSLDLAKVTPAMMTAYLQHLEVEYPNRNTRRARIYGLRRWFRYLTDHGHIPRDPCISLPPIPRQPPKLNRLLSREQVEAFFHAIPPLSSFPERDLAMFGCLSNLGLRPTELVSMTVGDIDWHGGLIHVQGKGNRDRLVPLNGPLLLALERYVATQESDSPEGDLWLDQGRALTTGRLRSLFHRYRKAAGIPSGAGGPHVFRHFFITQNLLAGANLRDLAAIVGHSNVRSLEAYFHVSTEQLRAQLTTALKKEGTHEPSAGPATAKPR